MTNQPSTRSETNLTGLKEEKPQEIKELTEDEEEEQFIKFIDETRKNIHVLIYKMLQIKLTHKLERETDIQEDLAYLIHLFE